jgi:uncharacterized zinc-type alcohol dehydrogenase-like protein
MVKTLSYAAQNEKTPLAPYSFERRDPKPHDILIDILYCGICHTDIHQARNEWGGSSYPMVPGHEIVGKVSKIGDKVTKFKIGDMAGVGCMVDSCRSCESCSEGEEQLCENQISFTYNGVEQDKKTPTQGGYSSNIVVDENFALKVSNKLEPAGTAPLLCAGITTYSPLKRWNLGKGHRLGVVGLGGLGHMAVKFGAAFGAEVTVISTSPSKETDAKRLGATGFLVSKDEAQMQASQNKFDFIIDTVAAQHDINSLLLLLKRDGKMTLVGAPDKPLSLGAFPLIVKRRSIAGSLIGGIKETQEMLDFCADKNILSEIELIPVQKVNEAFERTIKSDVRYRFVIDMKSLSQ